MTSAEILAAVQASPELTAMAQAGNTQGIADALSVGRTRLVPTEVGNGTILEVLDITKGNLLIDFIETHHDFRHVKPLVAQGRLRLDLPRTRETLRSLVPAVLSQDDVDALLACATTPDPITHTEVGAAIQGAF